jgi:hypothetical protein
MICIYPPRNSTLNKQRSYSLAAMTQDLAQLYTTSEAGSALAEDAHSFLRTTE